MSDWSFHVITFGCKSNQYESELLRQAWTCKGGVEAKSQASADYILINSCAITARAERNCRNAVIRARRENPAAKIILTGCAAQFYLEFKPRKNAPWSRPDLCIAQKDKSLLLAGPDGLGSAGSWQPLNASIRARAVVRIQDGCSQGCAYCIVPQTRPALASKPAEAILSECRGLINAGHAEIVISGINLRLYRPDFWAMLASIDKALFSEFGTAARLRISSLDPQMLTDRALAVLGESRLLARHLHLSLQHISRPVLRAMRRPWHEAADLAKKCAALAEAWPLMGLGADFITGFPGETETDLALLLEFIKDSRLTYAHVFPYSRRQGTEAAEMPGQIPKTEKERRAKLVREAVAQKELEFRKAQLGLREMRIVADGQAPGKKWRGVNEYYTACIPDWIPERQTQGLIKVRPIGLAPDGLKVRKLSDQA